jgi:hypothetical protein
MIFLAPYLFIQAAPAHDDSHTTRAHKLHDGRRNIKVKPVDT